MPTRIQANSLWLDYDLDNWAEIYSTWGSTFTGTFEINATVTGVSPVFTGTLTRSTTIPGRFHLRINYNTTSTTSPNPAWSSVATGTYKLMVEFNESTTKYREERHDRIAIKAQGI
jgi:hypothetical protein